MYRPLLWLVIISIFGFSHSQFCFSCCDFCFQRKKCNNTLKHLEFELDDVNKASCREDIWILAGEKVFFQNSSSVFLFVRRGRKNKQFLSPVFCSFSFLVLQGLRWMLTAGVGPDGKGSGIAILWCWSSVCFPVGGWPTSWPSSPLRAVTTAKSRTCKGTKWARLSYWNNWNRAILFTIHQNTF